MILSLLRRRDDYHELAIFSCAGTSLPLLGLILTPGCMTSYSLKLTDVGGNLKLVPWLARWLDPELWLVATFKYLPVMIGYVKLS